jgi:hypothetical protein
MAMTNTMLREQPADEPGARQAPSRTGRPIMTYDEQP